MQGLWNTWLLSAIIKINTSHNPKKLKVDANPNSIQKMHYSEWGQKIYSGIGLNAEGNFRTLLGSRNFKGIKNRGTKWINDELTQYVITHNIKKIHEDADINVLKTI